MSQSWPAGPCSSLAGLPRGPAPDFPLVVFPHRRAALGPGPRSSLGSPPQPPRLEKTLESPLDCKEIHQSILKEISPECSLKGLMLKLKLLYFGLL